MMRIFTTAICPDLLYLNSSNNIHVVNFFSCVLELLKFCRISCIIHWQFVWFSKWREINDNANNITIILDKMEDLELELTFQKSWSKNASTSFHMHVLLYLLSFSNKNSFYKNEQMNNVSLYDIFTWTFICRLVTTAE